MAVPDRFRSPHLARLWSTVHERLSTGRTVTRVSVPVRSDDEKLALATLLGLKRRPHDGYPLRIATLDGVCREAADLDVRAVVTELVGPLGDRAGDLAAARTARGELWAWVRAHPVVTSQPALHDWVADLRLTGTVDDTRELLDDVLTVLGELPATGRPRPDLAQHLLHDPHALDDGTRRATLVLKGLAAIHGVDPPTNAAERHTLWERAGVSGDVLSATVLVGGLRPAGDGLVATLLRACAEAGHAAALTLAQLRDPGDLDPGVSTVWAVENPAVLAVALDRFGPACPPLVCISGWPNGAATALLRALASRTTVRYHGDLDGEGLRIAAHVAATTGAVPWRMTAADYRAAVHERGPDVGRLTPVPWDPDLHTAMAEHRVAVPEEQVAQSLLDEMTSGRAP